MVDAAAPRLLVRYEPGKPLEDIAAELHQAGFSILRAYTQQPLLALNYDGPTAARKTARDALASLGLRVEDDVKVSYDARKS